MFKKTLTEINEFLYNCLCNSDTETTLFYGAIEHAIAWMGTSHKHKVKPDVPERDYASGYPLLVEGACSPSALASLAFFVSGHFFPLQTVPNLHFKEAPCYS